MGGQGGEVLGSLGAGVGGEKGEMLCALIVYRGGGSGEGLRTEGDALESSACLACERGALSGKRLDWHEKPLLLKLVSVKFVGLARALPTFTVGIPEQGCLHALRTSVHFCF